MQIAILGGGVAGLSSAIALKQKGFDVTVYERHPSLSTIGAGIVIWPNAAFVLQQLGVLEAIMKRSGQLTKMQRLTDSNEKLGAIDIVTINRLMGYPSLSILRRDFQAILKAKVESLGVRIKFDHAVMTIVNRDTSRTPNPTEIQFQNGTKITPDIIVGADGRMSSIARQYVFNKNSPVYQGFINWVGIYESGQDYFDEIAVLDYWGVGARFGIVPISPRKAYWAGGLASTEIGPNTPSEYKKELTTLFSKWPDYVQDMISHTPSEQINKIYVHDHDPTQTWFRNNVLMIGDAAHAPLPTSGQGAAQALEDAFHFAQCLANDRVNFQNAFKHFVKRRYQKTTNIILGARNLATSLFNVDKDYCAVRNANSIKTNYKELATAMSKTWAKGLPLNN